MVVVAPVMCRACHVAPVRPASSRGPRPIWCGPCAASPSRRESARREWRRLSHLGARKPSGGVSAERLTRLTGDWGPRHDAAVRLAEARIQARMAEQERIDAALPHARRCRCAQPAVKAEGPLTVCAVCSREVGP